MSSKKALLFLGSKSNLLYLFIKNKLHKELHLSKTLDDENKKKISDLFAENKNFKIQIFLDGAEQFYHLKKYPNVSKSSVKKMINRDMGKNNHGNSQDDIPSVEGEIIFHDKEEECWNHITVSSSLEDDIISWVNFILEVDNLYLSGIYNTPTECESFLNQILTYKKTEYERETQSKNFKEKKINILFFRTKINNLRQVIFYKGKIIFTRIVSYDLGKSFLNDFKNDLDRMTEYLARMVGNIDPGDINIISIFPDLVCQKMKQVEREDIKYQYFTISDISKVFNSKEKIESVGYNSDKILAISLLESKKRVLSFDYGKMKLLHKLDVIKKSVVLVAFFLICGMVLNLNIMNGQKQIKQQELQKLAIERSKYFKDLNEIKSKALSANNESDAAFIRSYGDIMKKANDGYERNFIDLIDKSSFLPTVNIVIDKIVFKDFASSRLFNKVSSLDKNTQKKRRVRKKTLAKKTEEKTNIDISFFGKLKIPSGNINDGFSSFDRFTISLNKKFPDYKIKKSEIPNNLKFNQKYFEIPVNFNLSK